jgi:hypothetical protein
MGGARRARELARSLLAEPLPRRWSHTQGVAATARRLEPILGQDAEMVEAAAWMHDIGYSPALVDTRMHALDGARYLRDVEHAEPLLCSLVGHHTGAIYEARERGLDAVLTSEFDCPPDNLAKALTYCDVTTSPDGENIDVGERLDEILARYEEGHPVNRTIRKARAYLLSSVKDIEALLMS